MTEISKWAEWAEISTIIAAVAGLWALCFAWLTYAASVIQENKEEFQALRSIARGLRVELELMKDWTAVGGEGYSEAMESPPDWSQPNRLIWKFDIGAVSNLTRSPYLYDLGNIVEPFARLNLWVSKLFQVYDEYRSFVNSDPGIFFATNIPPQYTENIVKFNRTMHIEIIGGAESKSDCLYKVYRAATSALADFEAGQRQRELPWWFCIGYCASAVWFVAGAFLLYMLLR
jgi:hypothetical protein